MAAQVVIRAVGDAPQLTPVGEGEGVFDVGGGTGVESKLCLFMIAQTQMLFLDAEREQPLPAVIFPVGEPLQVGAGLAEELALHLLELAGTEGEVAGGDLVAEGLAHLADAEGQLPSRSALDIGKVDENALGGLRAEIADGRGILGHADGRFEHQVEFADRSEVMLAADRADDILVSGDESVHLVKAHRVHVDLAVYVADQLVGAVAGLAAAAVQQRIGEACDVAGGDPGLGVHDDGGVEADIVGAFLNELLQPCFFDVVLEFNAERAVVPGIGQPAVDLAAGVDEAAVFAQGNDLVHCFFAVFHCFFPFLRLAAAESNFIISDKLTIYQIASGSAIKNCRPAFFFLKIKKK